MKYKVDNNQLKNLIQKFVNATLLEMEEPCREAFNNDFLDTPDWLNPHNCIDLDELDKIIVTQVTKSESEVKIKYPSFDVNVDIYYDTLNYRTAWEDFMWQIRDRIQSKYKITLRFKVDDEINTYKNRNW